MVRLIENVIESATHGWQSAPNISFDRIIKLEGRKPYWLEVR
jgi:hypothetical protein